MVNDNLNECECDLEFFFYSFKQNIGIRNGFSFAESSVKTIYLHASSIVTSNVTQFVENVDMTEGSSTLCLTRDLSLVLCRSWSFDFVLLAPGCIGR